MLKHMMLYNNNFIIQDDKIDGKLSVIWVEFNSEIIALRETIEDCAKFIYKFAEIMFNVGHGRIEDTYYVSVPKVDFSKWYDDFTFTKFWYGFLHSFKTILSEMTKETYLSIRMDDYIIDYLKTFGLKIIKEIDTKDDEHYTMAVLFGQPFFLDIMSYERECPYLMISNIECNDLAYHYNMYLMDCLHKEKPPYMKLRLVHLLRDRDKKGGYI